MEISRGTFLKVAGLAALGVVTKPVLDVFSRDAGVKAAAASENPVAGVAGTRWAMAVDLKACLRDKGCTDCIDACHRIHNVPDMGSKKEEIKWAWKAPYEKVFAEHQNPYVESEMTGEPVLLMCNHCSQPSCIKVCPTKATWQREDGIVMMDYHRCIGCRYCMAGCPYGARSFNWRDPRPYIKEIDPEYPTRMRGVVEKCNFCDKRLAQGQLPACVEACPEKALIFGNLKDPNSEIVQKLRDSFVLQRLPELGTNPNVYYIE